MVKERELFRCYDDWGMIRVLESGAFRYLAFGESAEQSCVLRVSPAQPVHQYIQGMLLALLFHPGPRQARVLGLGAGTLVNALLAYDTDLRIDAVELRPQVLTVARQWFDLPRDRRLRVHLEDAGDHMATLPPTDLLLVDIYDDAGMDPLQLSEPFLLDCYHSLAEKGVMVLNLWDQGGGHHPEASARLAAIFEQPCFSCPIDEGNLVIYAFKGAVPVLSQRRLLADARRLGRRLEFPAARLLSRIRAH